MRENIPHRDRRKIDSNDIFIETVELSECLVFSLLSHVSWHPRIVDDITLLPQP